MWGKQSQKGIYYYTVHLASAQNWWKYLQADVSLMKIGSNLSFFLFFFLKKKARGGGGGKERDRRLDNKNAFDTDVKETKAACNQRRLKWWRIPVAAYEQVSGKMVEKWDYVFCNYMGWFVRKKGITGPTFSQNIDQQCRLMKLPTKICNGFHFHYLLPQTIPGFNAILSCTAGM